MSHWILYHNPKCGTSRKVKAYLEEKNISFDTVEYLKDPLNVSGLEDLLKKLKSIPADITRTKEEVWKDGHYDPETLAKGKWLKLIADNPLLMQRPIVVKGNKAIVARPAETIEDFVKKNK